MIKPNVRLGKLPKRVDPRTWKLHFYLKPSIPAPPTHKEYVMAVPEWPMYDNDTLGDCVIAAAGHSIGQWSFLASGTEVLLADAQIIKGYEDVGGYNPNAPLNPDGSNPTDNGCDMLTACKYWRKTGFGGHTIVGFVEVNPANMAEVEQAIYLFGNLFTGFQLPLAVQGSSYWGAPPAGLPDNWQQGSWGGHCVPICSYDQKAMCCVTWGQRLDMDCGFFSAYCDEAYAIISQEWIEKTGLSVSGFNLAALQSDLASL